MITFRYCLRPTSDQVAILNRHIDICRQLYNKLLGELNCAHTRGHILSKRTAQGFLPNWKVVGFPELSEVYSKVAQMVVHQLCANLAGLAGRKRQGFKVGKLRYKGHRCYTTLNYNQSVFNIDMKQGTIRFAKVGVVRATFHQDLPSSLTVKGIVVKRSQTGKWHACLQCEEHSRTEASDEPARATPVLATLATSGNAIGIDLGITHFVADSDGYFAASPGFLDQSLTKLQVLQKALSRKKKGSHRYVKAMYVLAKQHEKVAHQRRDFLHKLSRYYIRKYDVICAEDLAVAGMLTEKRSGLGKVKQKTLHRHIADSGWRMFLDMLAYKAQSAGKLAIFVDARGTSQECAVCGITILKKLWERMHNCPQCGFTIDRDTNASLVIRKRGTGRAPTPVELAPLLRLTGASVGEEAGTLIKSLNIVIS